MQIQPVRGPEIDLDFTGRHYQREHLPQQAGNGDICQIAYSGGSGWYTQTYCWHGVSWVLQTDTHPWQMDAWNIGDR